MREWDFWYCKWWYTPSRGWRRNSAIKTVPKVVWVVLYSYSPVSSLDLDKLLPADGAEAMVRGGNGTSMARTVDLHSL